MTTRTVDSYAHNKIPMRLLEAWDGLADEERTTIAAVINFVLKKHESRPEENTPAGLASFYRPLTEEEMFAEIGEGLKQAEQGACITIEESRAKHNAKYGMRRQ